MGIIKPYYETELGRLYHGDCLEILPHLEPADAVVTDPPYGINHSSSHGASWQNTTIVGDNDTTLRDNVIEKFSCAAVFGTWKTPPIKNIRGCLVWDKGPAFGMGDLSFPWKPSWEQIYIKGNLWEGKRDEGVIRKHIQVSWESKGRKHPHQKPTSLIVYLLKKTTAKTILDPFLGSGTTAVACERLKRRWIGIEIEEKYCQIAVKRIEAERRQLKLF
jgi:DNA modification methylase